MKKHWMAVAAVSCACGAFAGTASAHGRGGGYGPGPGPGYGGSNLDLYYVPSADVEFENGDDDGDGFGGKAAFRVGRDVFLTGEYQRNTYDEEDRDLDEFRLGAAFGPGAGNGDGLYARVDYVNYDLELAEEQDGIGGHVGFALPVSPTFKLFGEVGYLALTDFDGPEFVGGAVLQVAPNLGVYGDYRATRLEDDNDVKVDLDDFRIGVRLTF